MTPRQRPADQESLGPAATADKVPHWESTTVGKADAAATTTLASSTLLEHAADEDHPRTNEAWREIDARYRPLVIAYAQGKGLLRASAETVAQDAMIAFSNAVRGGKVDPQRSARGYLFGIARNKLIDYIKKGGTIDRLPDQMPLNESALPTTPQADPDWEPSLTRAIEDRIQDEIKLHFKSRDTEIWRERKLEGRPSRDVAERHDVTVTAVDMVVHKIKAFLQEIEPVIRARF